MARYLFVPICIKLYIPLLPSIAVGVPTVKELPDNVATATHGGLTAPVTITEVADNGYIPVIALMLAPAALTEIDVPDTVNTYGYATAAAMSYDIAINVVLVRGAAPLKLLPLVPVFPICTTVPAEIVVPDTERTTPRGAGPNTLSSKHSRAELVIKVKS